MYCMLNFPIIAKRPSYLKNTLELVFNTNRFAYMKLSCFFTPNFYKRRYDNDC